MTTINTNVYSLNAQRNLAKNSLGLSSALERLSSGLRVNSAKDDAAGLAIGMDMDKAARGIAADIRQQSDEISKNQTADGGLSVIGDMALRVSELVKQKDNPNLTTDQEGYIDKEIKALSDASKDIIDNTKFNETKVISVAQIAADGANADAVITAVASARADAGAAINTAEFKIQSLRVNYEAQMAAKGRIMDADFAEETSRLARFQILQQAGTAMISQANAVPQNVLSLLR
jgi:flagellin